MRIGAHPSLLFPPPAVAAAAVYACAAPSPLRGTSRTTAVGSGPLFRIASSKLQRWLRAGAAARHPPAQCIASSSRSAASGRSGAGQRVRRMARGKRVCVGLLGVAVLAAAVALSAEEEGINNKKRFLQLWCLCLLV
ncbi:surface protease GP63 [Trypanosoma conorhini]|uniref:Surface protease GP63 n=1 Tax=Trypanosoma conorhini TaxID=83891 RepID=A0A422PJ49_9TRYP|nr:surface protease GP63 [Trypanosoma conorhini]RNF17735.1 surface protease GP63 [Trypanosoma conorhini]